MEQHTWVARVGMNRPSPNLTRRFELPTVHTRSIADVNLSGTEPESVEAASAFQTDPEKLRKLTVLLF